MKFNRLFPTGLLLSSRKDFYKEGVGVHKQGSAHQHVGLRQSLGSSNGGTEGVDALHKSLANQSPRMSQNDFQLHEDPSDDTLGNTALMDNSR
jgi:hypothetical protein